MKTLRVYPCLLIVSLALCIASNEAAAQPHLVLSHDSYWKVVRREVVIQARTVNNTGTEDSEPLFISLYATEGSIFDGGERGRLLARAPIGSIAAGQQTNDVMVQTRVRLPKAVPQYTALLLEKQTGKKTFEIEDYVVFQSQYSFPRKQDGGVGSEDAAIGTGNIAVEDMDFVISGRKATFNIGKIQNQRPENATGPLRISMHATPEPYSPMASNEFIMATGPLGDLAPGDYFTGQHGTLTMKRPRMHGAYYVTLVVEEETESGFVPAGYLSEAEPREL
jgi:hypothetical protein